MSPDMVRHAVYICFPFNLKCLIWQTIMCCSFRTWWRKPARRRVCKRQATPRCGTTANSGASPPRGSALRHLAPTTSQPWMCQQDTGQVTTGLTITWWQPQFSIHCSVLLSGTQRDPQMWRKTRKCNLLSWRRTVNKGFTLFEGTHSVCFTLY